MPQINETTWVIEHIMDQLVSVIIPVYNRNEQAIRAIRSVTMQQDCNLEIIVVDDASVPPLKLPKEMLDDKRIRLVRLKQNKGVSHARNTGAEMANGTWLAWLDSDDEWYQGKMSSQLSYLKKLKNSANDIVLATGFEYVDATIGATGTPIKERRSPIASSDPLHFFAGCWFCPGSTVMLSRQLFERVGPYDTNMRRLEDLDWFARMVLLGGRLEVVSSCLVMISKGGYPSYEKVKKAGDYLVQKYSDDKKSLPPKAYQNLTAYLQLEYAASTLRQDGTKLLGFVSLIKSLWSVPRLHLHLYPFWKQDDLEHNENEMKQ